MAELAPPTSPPSSIATRLPWAPIAWFAILISILYAIVIYRMVGEWANEESMGHGFFVPLVAGYIIWQRREEILRQALQPSWMGWVLVPLGFAMLVAGYLGADFFIMRVSLLVTMLGVILATCGWPIIRTLGFPLFLLLFMIRIPLFIYSQITFPLQLLASTIAAEALTLMGIPVFQEGNVLELADQKLQVVEACSGIRSLLSLAFLSLVYGYFFDRRPWMRLVLLVSSLPIAIGANAIRVTLTGLLSGYRRDLAEGFYHTLEGWLLFMLALCGLLLVHWVINRFWPQPSQAAPKAEVETRHV